MDAEFYVEILEKLIKEINNTLGNNWRLQQDDDLKRASHRAREFLKESNRLAFQ